MEKEDADVMDYGRSKLNEAELVSPNLFRRLHTAASEVTRRKSGEEAGRTGPRNRDLSHPFETMGDTVRPMNKAGESPSSERLMGPAGTLKVRKDRRAHHDGGTAAVCAGGAV